jgi:hypothetical protein
MAVNPFTKLVTPVQLEEAETSGADTIVIDVVSAAPDGNTEPQLSAPKGSVSIRDNQTDDLSSWYLKVDDSNSDDDWVQFIVANSEEAHTQEGDWTWSADKKVLFRDSAIYIHSNADGYLHIQADTGITLGDGTNDLTIASDGTVSLAGTAAVTKRLSFPIFSGGGTANTATFIGAPSINLDADTETFLCAVRMPPDWDAASDITIFLDVGNEIAETDGDDLSFTGQVRGYADGETMSDAGQTVAILQDLTGGDQAINVINRATGTIDYDHGTYPIAVNDTLVIELTVNLGAGTEATGPLHVIAWGIEYTANKLGA